MWENGEAPEERMKIEENKSTKSKRSWYGKRMSSLLYSKSIKTEA